MKSNNILELGAGCGLAGLVCAHLSDVELVVFTDYDPGSLKLIKDNINANIINQNVKCYSHFLEWGKSCYDVKNIKEVNNLNGFHLIIGSDLIYSIDIINPLFHTIQQLMNTLNGKFLLVTSFMLNDVSIFMINYLIL